MKNNESTALNLGNAQQVPSQAKREARPLIFTRPEWRSSSAFGVSRFLAVLTLGVTTCGCGCAERDIADRFPEMPISGSNYNDNVTEFAKNTIRSWIRSPDNADISIEDTSVLRKQGNPGTKDPEFTAQGTVLLSSKSGDQKHVQFFIKVRGEESNFECTMLDIGNIPLVNELHNVRLGPSDRFEVDEKDDISISLLLDRL